MLRYDLDCFAERDAVGDFARFFPHLNEVVEVDMALFGARGDHLPCRLEGDLSRFDKIPDLLALAVDRIDVIVQVKIEARHVAAKMSSEAFGFDR